MPRLWLSIKLINSCIFRVISWLIVFGGIIARVFAFTTTLLILSVIIRIGSDRVWK